MLLLTIFYDEHFLDTMCSRSAMVLFSLAKISTGAKGASVVAKAVTGHGPRAEARRAEAGGRAAIVGPISASLRESCLIILGE